MNDEILLVLGVDEAESNGQRELVAVVLHTERREHRLPVAKLDLLDAHLGHEELGALLDVGAQDGLGTLWDSVAVVLQPRVEPGGVARTENDDVVFADLELRLDLQAALRGGGVQLEAARTECPEDIRAFIFGGREPIRFADKLARVREASEHVHGNLCVAPRVSLLQL